MMNGSTRFDETSPIILENPDGTLVSGIPIKSYEAIERVPVIHTQQQTPSFSARVYLVDGNIETVYSRNRAFFLGLIAVDLFSNTGFVIYWCIESSDSIDAIEKEIQGLSRAELRRAFWVTIFLFVLHEIIMCVTGVQAIISRRERSLTKFIWLSLVGLIFLMGAIYVNRLSILLFFLRLMELFYARYIRTMFHQLAFTSLD
eukprot:TRINITY_DN2874_c0_g3_i1.p1 TRINITY_DN2874_c0_g3~~TRINITY_DN2874_c0_g3_i1.p1  ORF type:complete len:202 (+),score=36.88 TRINITY_DN2874_c0_g3_i1:44-649(+)